MTHYIFLECTGDSIQQSIDKSLDPCTNFYDYGCGLWIKNNPVPSDSLELSKKILRESEIMYRMKGMKSSGERKST